MKLDARQEICVSQEMQKARDRECKGSTENILLLSG